MSTAVPSNQVLVPIPSDSTSTAYTVNPTIPSNNTPDQDFSSGGNDPQNYILGLKQSVFIGICCGAAFILIVIFTLLYLYSPCCGRRRNRSSRFGQKRNMSSSGSSSLTHRNLKLPLETEFALPKVYRDRHRQQQEMRRHGNVFARPPNPTYVRDKITQRTFSIQIEDDDDLVSSSSVMLPSYHPNTNYSNSNSNANSTAFVTSNTISNTDLVRQGGTEIFSMGSEHDSLPYVSQKLSRMSSLYTAASSGQVSRSAAGGSLRRHTKESSDSISGRSAHDFQENGNLKRRSLRESSSFFGDSIYEDYYQSGTLKSIHSTNIIKAINNSPSNRIHFGVRDSMYTIAAWAESVQYKQDKPHQSKEEPVADDDTTHPSSSFIQLRKTISEGGPSHSDKHTVSISHHENKTNNNQHIRPKSSLPMISSSPDETSAIAPPTENDNIQEIYDIPLPKLKTSILLPTPAHSRITSITSSFSQIISDSLTKDAIDMLVHTDFIPSNKTEMGMSEGDVIALIEKIDFNLGYGINS